MLNVPPDTRIFARRRCKNCGASYKVKRRLAIIEGFVSEIGREKNRLCPGCRRIKYAPQEALK